MARFDVSTLAANIGRELDTLKASDACKQALRVLVTNHTNRVAYLEEQVDAATIKHLRRMEFLIPLTDNDNRDLEVGRAVQFAVRHGLFTRGELEKEAGFEYLRIKCWDDLVEDEE